MVCTEATTSHWVTQSTALMWAYLRDVFERLPTLKQRDLAQLLAHNWRPLGGNAAATDPRPVVAA